jgi:hypothetical protein
MLLTVFDFAVVDARALCRGYFRDYQSAIVLTFGCGIERLT